MKLPRNTRYAVLDMFSTTIATFANAQMMVARYTVPIPNASTVI